MCPSGSEVSSETGSLGNQSLEITLRVKVILSAYACEPGKGSEPEVGWRVATTMAGCCQIHVLTRSNNRPAIEDALGKVDGPKPEFLYYDLPSCFLHLKKAGLGTAGYYFLWQAAVRWKFRHFLNEVDLVHHVTFNGMQVPGFWIGTDTPVVLGPLGGGMTCPGEYLGLMGNGARREKLRSRIIDALVFLPWWKKVIRDASVVLAANRETASVLQPHRTEVVPVMLETAMSEESVALPLASRKAGSPMKFLWLGNLLPRKAPILAVRALAVALKKEDHLELLIAGAGPEETRLREEVAELGLEQQVKMLGRIPKAEVEALMDQVDAFVFTSVRDTSGNVVLEAMSRGLPCITLWHQGVREICDETTAILVSPGSIEQTIEKLAEAMVRLSREDGLAQRFGLAGREKVKGFLTWENYRQRMMAVYRGAVER
jgi:glycosyltransferase involved in cell wall biosynthesis